MNRNQENARNTNIYKSITYVNKKTFSLCVFDIETVRF